MGFSNRPRTGGKFINFKTKTNASGKDESFLSNAGELHSEFTGVLVDISLDDAEFKGVAYQKLILHLVDPDSKKVFELGMPVRSGYAFAFFAMCPNIDPALPLTISGGIEKMENGNSWGKMFISQNGKNLQWYYSKKNEDAYKLIPAVKLVKVGKGAKATEVKDYSDRDEYIEKVLFGFKDKKVHKAHPGGVKAALANAPKHDDAVSYNNSDDNEPIDDLPF